jgi:hypothetical protein
MSSAGREVACNDQAGRWELVGAASAASDHAAHSPPAADRGVTARCGERTFVSERTVVHHAGRPRRKGGVV